MKILNLKPTVPTVTDARQAAAQVVKSVRPYKWQNTFQEAQKAMRRSNLVKRRWSAFSFGSYFSFLSVFSLFSAVSVLSFGSIGSILSIGSSGSLLSIGSTGSILSIGGAGSILSIGSAGGLVQRGRTKRSAASEDVGAEA